MAKDITTEPIRQTNKAKAAEAAFGLFFLCLGLAAVTGVVWDRFGLPEVQGAVKFACLYAVLLTPLFAFVPWKPRALILAAWAVGWAVFGYRNREAYLLAAKTIERIVVPDLNNLLPFTFPNVRPSTMRELARCSQFMLFAMQPYAAVLAWAVVRRQNGWFCVIWTLLPFAFVCVLKDLPTDALLWAMLVFWMAMPLRTKYRRTAPGSDALAVGLAALVVTGCFVIVPRADYTENPKVYEWRETIADAALRAEQAVSDAVNIWSDLSFGFTGNNGLTRFHGPTNLDDTGQIHFPDVAVLQVQLERPTGMLPRPLYLRGRSAVDYTGHAWLPAETELFQPDEPFSSAAYIPLPVRQFFPYGPPVSETVHITHLNERSRVMFLPYFATGLPHVSPLTVWTNDSYLPYNKQKTYNTDSYTLDGAARVITGIKDIPALPTAYTTARASEYINGYFFEFIRNGESLGVFDPPALPMAEGADTYRQLFDLAFAADGDGAAMLDYWYPKAEPDAVYVAHLIQEYTQLPEGLRQRLYAWLAEQPLTVQMSFPGASDAESLADIPYWHWGLAAAITAEAVRTTAVYTESPGKQPANRDFAEYFLTESKQGYCMHFATATTAVLRALGVPARYVEGYLVGADAFDKDGNATVYAKDAHAWTEIWIPGLGWIPVESTPGFAGTPQTIAATAAPTATATPAPTASPTPAPTQTQPPPSPTPTATVPPSHTNTAKPQKDSQLGEVMTFAAATLLVVGTLFAVPFAWRRLVRRWRGRQFACSDRKRAALSVYVHLLRLAALGGADVSEEALCVAQKARFSRHAPTESEIAFLREEAAHSADCLRQKGRWTRVKAWFFGV